MSGKWLAITSLLFSLQAKAYYVATNKIDFDANKPTRLIVTGTPEKLGNLFLESAITKMKIYLELNPNEQIVILGTSDDESSAKRNKNIKVIKNENGLLKKAVIEEYIEKLNQIKSFDLYAHSNALEGVIVDKGGLSSVTLNEKDALWDKLQPKLSVDSFIMIHGCNAGVKMAPDLAMKIQKPVLAALTSSDFQKVYENKTWAFDYDNQNLNKDQNDTRLRMRPINSSYKGHWGDWTEGGFPTYKIFCGKMKEELCSLGAYEAVRTFPTVLEASAINSKETYQKALIDFMCPVSTFRPTFSECEKNLLNANDNKEYSPFRGKTLNCNLEKCAAHFKCNIITISINPGSCKLINEDQGTNTAFVDEYLFLLKAYDHATKK